MNRRLERQRHEKTRTNMGRWWTIIWMYRHMETLLGGCTDKYMDRQIYGQTNLWTDIWMERQMDGQTGRMADRCIDRQMDGQTDGWTDSWNGRHMDCQTDRWIDS